MSEYLIGTRDGYSRLRADASEPTRVPGYSGTVTVVAGPRTTYAVTSEGVVRDAATDPTAVPVPTDDPTHLAADEHGPIVGGRDPLAIHVARDPTGAWTTHELPDLDPATRWTSDGARVVSEAGGRVSDTLRVREGIAVAVERTGVLVWTGDGWTTRHHGLAEDVHDLYRVARDEWLAATGHGLYRTTDAGHAWHRLDTGQRFQRYSYFHEFAVHDDTIYTSGGRHVPGGWEGRGAEALLFRVGTDRSPLREANTPEPDEYAWALAGGESLLVGTATGDLDGAATADGVVYERPAPDADWRTVCRVPAPITSVVRSP